MVGYVPLLQFPPENYRYTVKVQGTLPRPTTSLYIYNFHPQILGERLGCHQRDKRNRRISRNPMQPITKLSGEQERLDLGNGDLGCRSPVARLGPADIPITGGSHETPTRRAGAPMEADRTERVLPCCMVVLIVPRCSPSAHARRCHRGVKLEDEGYINHGTLTPLCGT